ncbi:hypothetical protein RNAN_2758 [Rheinheimera nanhaiensis E407-8]|uniref:Uncharacterized protein n=1 Tax=Rheinheimera nanhaiensis E407-8 TaxID=562729 RepID=I1E0C4_9GAMM|nr:hypothetical protein RNAN_2758 [Rheinheimera nanhaiensis E407-8]
MATYPTNYPCQPFNGLLLAGKVVTIDALHPTRISFYV